MALHSRTFRLTDKAVQILDAQEHKTAFVIDCIINSQALPKDMNRCYKCGSVLPLECFDRDKTRSSGVGNLCKNCKSIKNNAKK
jgi:hypothetical protein